MNETNNGDHPAPKANRINRTNRFDVALYEELAVQAKKENRSISNLLETAALEYIRRRAG